MYIKKKQGGDCFARGTRQGSKEKVEGKRGGGEEEGEEGKWVSSARGSVSEATSR